MAKVPIGSPATAKTKETAASSVPRGRNLVVLCDGPGNELGGALADVESDIRISNVLKLSRIAEKCKRQLVYYTPGDGTVGRVAFLYRTKQKSLGEIGSTSWTEKEG